MGIEDKIAEITGAEDFLDQNGLISRVSVKKLCEAGIIKPFFENNNQKKILESLFNVGYFCERDEQAVDLGLLTGIEGGLVVQTLLNFGGEKFKDIAEKVTNGEMIGGFAVTEEGKSGSLAHKMSTEYSYDEEKLSYRIKTNKENPKWFQGASMGDFLIVIARKRKEYALFYVTQDNIKSTPIETAGLNSIRYARNEIDCVVPKENLIKEIGPREFPELFIRSRLQLIGINYGIIKKVLDIYEKVTEVIKDKVEMETFDMNVREMVVNVLCQSVAEIVDPQKTIEDLSSIAAMVKSIGSKMMQESAEELRRKFGAAGFERGHKAEKISNSTLPFTVFEGSNEMLFASLIQKLNKAPEELKSLVSKESFERISSFLTKSDGNKQLIGEIISWIFTKDQAKKNTNFLEDAKISKESFFNYIEKRINKLKIDLDFYSNNSLLT